MQFQYLRQMNLIFLGSIIFIILGKTIEFCGRPSVVGIADFLEAQR